MPKKLKLPPELVAKYEERARRANAILVARRERHQSEKNKRTTPENYAN